MRPTRADGEKTNKISSPQPSPKERECSNGKSETKNERTKDGASRTGRWEKDEQKTKERRTKDEGMTNNERRKDRDKVNLTQR